MTRSLYTGAILAALFCFLRPDLVMQPWLACSSHWSSCSIISAYPLPCLANASLLRTRQLHACKPQNQVVTGYGLTLLKEFLFAKRPGDIMGGVKCRGISLFIIPIIQECSPSETSLRRDVFSPLWCQKCRDCLSALSLEFTSQSMQPGTPSTIEVTGRLKLQKWLG